MNNIPDQRIASADMKKKRLKRWLRDHSGEFLGIASVITVVNWISSGWKSWTRILHKVSLTWILNDATPGCTSWRGYRAGSWLCGCEQLRAMHELIIHAITDWTARDQGNNVAISYSTCVAASQTQTANVCSSVCVSLGTSQTASNILTLWKGSCRCCRAWSVAQLNSPSAGAVLSFKENTARLEHDL